MLKTDRMKAVLFWLINIVRQIVEKPFVPNNDLHR